MNNSVCANCIRDPVCYIPEKMPDSDKYFGWCNKCNTCPLCDKKIANRIYWRTCSEFKLYTDRCEEHIDINDCKCSKNAKDITIIPYIYN